MTVATTLAPDGDAVTPKLIDLCLSEARVAADAIPLTLDGVQFDDVGLVVAQDPDAGTPIQTGSPVLLEIEASANCDG